MSKAVKVVHEKIRTSAGVIVEIKVWRVAKTEDYPEGVKYSFFAVFEGRVLVGYDNHKPKGHHRHTDGKERQYLFTDFETLRRDFRIDLDRALDKLR